MSHANWSSINQQITTETLSNFPFIHFAALETHQSKFLVIGKTKRHEHCKAFRLLCLALPLLLSKNILYKKTGRTISKKPDLEISHMNIRRTTESTACGGTVNRSTGAYTRNALVRGYPDSPRRAPLQRKIPLEKAQAPMHGKL